MADHQGESSSKSKRSSNTPRKRVSQACDRCRARKDKCDGQKPVCSTCASQDAICNYDSNTKKRGLPEGYVRGIEKLWGLSIRQIEQIEEKVLGILNEESTADVWNDGSNSAETLQETWRNSQISKELERLLPLLEVEEKSGKRKREGARGDSISEGRPASKTTPKLQGDGSFGLTSHSHDQVATSMVDPLLRGDASYTGAQAKSIGSVSETVASVPRGGSKKASEEEHPKPFPSSMSEAPARLPDRSFRLIDIYFSYTHSWFPILEKYDIMRFSHQYSATPRPGSGQGSQQATSGTGQRAVIWAILAYADYQRLAFSESQDQSDAPDLTPDTMYSYARILIPNESGIYEIGHVQALLILTLYNMGTGNWNKAWHMVGQATRIAIDLGLDRLDSPKSKRSQHVFLGCFVLDTIVAARLKRRPQLRREDLGQSNQVEEDGLEEWDPLNDSLAVSTTEASRGPALILSTFNQLIRIIAILNDTICIPRISDPSSSLTVLLQDIQGLQHPLPPPFKPAWETKTASKPLAAPIQPHHYHLHMSYISTLATLYISAKAGGYYLDRSAEDVAASTIKQMAKLLKHHSQHFGLLVLPPTYDYHTLIAGQCALIDQNPLDDYRLDIQHSLSTMVRAWPTYRSIDNLFATGELEPISETSKQEQHIRERNSFSAAIPQQQNANLRKQSFPETSNAPRSVASSHVRAQSFNPNTQASPNMSRFNSNDQELLSTFGKQPFVDLSIANMQNISPSTPFVPQTPTSQSWSGNTPGREVYSTHTTGSTISNNPQIPLPPPSVFEGTVTSMDIDGDSMFNEFATLDAMEWTNNWDQSLLNLGFTDPSSMNQDFYAFCREPDPLYPNDLVQQLLSSSNMGGGGGGMGDGMGNGGIAGAGNTSRRGDGTDGGRGFEMEGSNAMIYTNPHVEASHILQALATAQERGQNPS